MFCVCLHSYKPASFVFSLQVQQQFSTLCSVFACDATKKRAPFCVFHATLQLSALHFVFASTATPYLTQFCLCYNLARSILRFLVTLQLSTATYNLASSVLCLLAQKQLGALSF